MFNHWIFFTYIAFRDTNNQKIYSIVKDNYPLTDKIVTFLQHIVKKVLFYYDIQKI